MRGRWRARLTRVTDTSTPSVSSTASAPPIVQLFHTCLVNEIAPAIGFAAVRVLERLGFAVEVPLAQTCCGQPAFNAGFHDAARVAARHSIDVFSATDGPIVVLSGSCGDMLLHQYAVLFKEDEEWQARAMAVLTRCREFSAFVAAHAPDDLFAGVRARVVYHPSCHLARGLGIDAAPRRLMAAATGGNATRFPGDDDCCGFGGLFAVKHAEISSRMLERKIDQLTAIGVGVSDREGGTDGPDRVVSCDLGCLLQIGGGLHRRGSPVIVQHLAELLAETLP